MLSRQTQLPAEPIDGERATSVCDPPQCLPHRGRWGRTHEPRGEDLLQREGERYALANEALYRELFPEDRKVINLRAQFDQHLAEAAGSGQSQLLALLDQAAAAIGEGGAQVQVDQLDFNAQRGDLAFNLRASDFAALESLRARLQEAGLAVDMGSASREDNGVSARLVIGGNG